LIVRQIPTHWAVPEQPSATISQECPMTKAPLKTIEQRLLWLSHWMIHNANHILPKADGIKVGGHQASSASMVSIMTALYFSVLRPEDRVAVKPHASPMRRRSSMRCNT
jgi:pyruvate dehydrogenase complex dehydrogenase (E1) component